MIGFRGRKALDAPRKGSISRQAAREGVRKVKTAKDNCENELLMPLSELRIKWKEQDQAAEKQREYIKSLAARKD